jgi:hypothetical protein
MRPQQRRVLRVPALVVASLVLAVLACSVDTGLEPTPTAIDGSLCDNSAFVADVSIPDGTAVQPGAKFTKTWRINNTGSCTWSTGYRLALVDGNAMGGGSTSLLAPVAPGTQTDISVAMTAPATNGTFRGNWRMQNASGQPFGSIIYVQIKVDGGTPPTTPASNVTISGAFNVAEVAINFSNASSIPAVNYSANGYTFSVPSGWTGTIAPSKGASGNWSFDPSSWTFTNVTSNQTRDFTGIPTTPTP